MISASTVMSGAYDYGEVARSVFIAIAASYVALDLTGRVTAAKGRARVLWLSGGATAMGIGIWEMHFKGMLAFHLPVPVAYHWPTVLASLVVAVFASAIAMFVASRQKMGRSEAFLGSVIMGGAIAGMHYVGMAAMRLPATTRYSPFLVILSILLAILFSLIALLMAFDLREETKWTVRRRSGSAIVMGIAVSAMHYTGMAAASFFPSSPPDLTRTVNITPLGDSAVVIVTLIVLLTAVITSSVDRQADEKIRRLNQELERHVEERTSQLAGVNEELKKLRDELRLVVDTIPQQIWSARPDGYVDFCNERWRSYMGLTLEDVQSDGWQRVLHPDERGAVLKTWRESAVNGTPYEREERHRAADGTYRWFLARGIPLRDAEGRIVRWYGTNTDIEDRKRAEEALRRSEAYLAEAQRLTQTGSWAFRPGMAKPVYWSEEMFRIWGFDPQQGLPDNETVWQRIHPEDRKAVVQEQIEKASAGSFKVDVDNEFRIVLPDGTVKHIRGTSHPVFDDTGKVVEYVGTAVDVTERKRAEEAIRRSEKELRDVVDITPAMLHSARPDGYLDFFNKRWLEYIGCSLEDVCGWGWTRFIHPDDVEQEVSRWRSALATGEPFEAEARVRRADGEYRWQLHRKVPARDEQGKIVRWYGSSIDVEERMQAELALRESQAELARVIRIATMGELTASIAHEINQPLGAVVTNGNAALRWLAARPPNLNEVRDAIDRAIREASRASDVIRRIRALLQKVPPQTERLDVNAIIREALALAHGELLRGGVTVQTELTPDVPTVLGDRVQLQQVMLNLILNAIDAMSTVADRPRKLLIKSAQHPDGVVVQVQDSGTGLDPELVDHIFEPFVTTKPEGIGMGLSIGRSIVETHGGSLWATSSSSQGAVFQFTLPKAVDERAA